jgi:hypothetical protein
MDTNMNVDKMSQDRRQFIGAAAIGVAFGIRLRAVRLAAPSLPIS